MLLYDKEYSDLQADEKFEWGTYRQDLRDFQLVSKRDNLTARAINEASGATKAREKLSVNNDRRRGPLLPDGREICRSFNNNSYYRQDCKMMHHCAICMSSTHSALSGHGHNVATQAIAKPTKNNGLNHAAKNFKCLRFEAWNRLLPASVEDRDFILNGVKDGFKLSVIYGPHLPVDRDNYTSAFRFRSAVENRLN